MTVLIRGRPGIDAYDEGVLVGLGAPAMNFVGANVAVTYDAANDRYVVTISAPPGDIIQDADADTYIDVEPTADADKIKIHVPATSAIFQELFKGAEASPRLVTQDDGLLIGGGAAAPDVDLRRIAADIVGLHDGTNGDAIELMYVNTTPGTPGSGKARLYYRLFGTGYALFLKDNNGIEFGPIGDKAQATIFGKGPAGGLEPPGTATWSDGLWGTLAPAALWTVTGTPSVANDTAANRGRYDNFQSGAVAGNDAGIETPTVLWANKGDTLLVRFQLPTITNIRAFLGIGAMTLATAVGADDPGVNHLALQFSTPRGDTNWQFAQRGGFGQTVTDSGVAVTTAPFYLQLLTGQITQLTLFNSTFAPLAVVQPGPLDKPASTTLVRIILGIETQTGAARDLRVYQLAHHVRQA